MIKNDLKILVRCRLACEAEAVAHGFPPETGKEIFYGFFREKIANWDDDKFLKWIFTLEEKYQEKTGNLSREKAPSVPSIWSLYSVSCEIIINYLSLMIL